MRLPALLLLAALPIALALGCGDDEGDDGPSTQPETNDGTGSDTGSSEPDETQDDSGSQEPDSDNPATASEQETVTETASQDPGLPLELGDEVPDFTLPTHDGGTFTLSDHKGSIVLIGTHPFAGTSVCTQQTKDLEENYDAFADLDTIPFGMGVDGTAKQATWATSMGIERLKILSDSNPRGGVSDMFGFFDKATKTSKRGVLIIDRDGKLAFKKSYPMAICPALGPIFEELEKLQ